MTLLAAWRRNQEGATAVELAFVALPLFLVIFGVLEFGRALWDHNALQQTAIAAARCEGISRGSLGSTFACNSTTATAYAEQVAAAWGMTLTDSNVTVTPNTTCGGVSGFSQVTLSYTFQSAVPQLLTTFNGGMPMSATACFPIQP